MLRGKYRIRGTTGLKRLVIRAVIFNLMAVAALACAPAGVPAGDRNETIRPDGILEFVGSDDTVLATIDIEIAETAEARRSGLMGRTTLRMTDGMLFIFEQAQQRGFWMYNTPVSLDMIFVDSEKRIVHIVESTRPMSTQTYSSRFPARYVVEVPAGFVKFFKIKANMRIRWQRR